jgi:hypothetical protein
MIAQSPSSGITNVLLSSFDILEPIWSNQLYRPYNSQGADLLTFMWAIGAKAPVTQETGEHWEEDRYKSAFAVKANVSAPSAGANLTIALAAGYIDASTRQSYPIVGDLVRHIPSGAQYEIITKTDNGTDTTLVLRPLKATTAQAMTANDMFWIYSNTVKEGSTQRDMQTSFQTAYTWELQNVRTDNKISGNAVTDSLKVVQYNGTGTPIQGYNSIQTVQDEYRHLDAIVGAMIWGQSTTNTGFTAYSNGTSTGIIEQFLARAANRATGGSLGVDDFEALEATLSANWSGDNYLALLSGKSFNEISADMFSDFNQSNMNAVVSQLSNALFGQNAMGAEQLAATYTFKALTVNGRNFALRRLLLFDDPAGVGATADNFNQDYGMVWPIGVSVVKNAEGTESVRKHVLVKYKDYAGYNRLMRMWETGGMASTNKTPVDELNNHTISNVGFDFASLQQCGLFKNA